VSVQEFGERKIFVIDNGLLNSVVFKFSADRGKAMEQVVAKEKETVLFFKKTVMNATLSLYPRPVGLPMSSRCPAISAIRVPYKLYFVAGFTYK
jgi:hypothetical protein